MCKFKTSKEEQYHYIDRQYQRDPFNRKNNYRKIHPSKICVNNQLM